MRDQTKNMLTGGFILAACALIVYLVIYLKPTVGNGEEILHVRFSDVTGIHVGTRVLLAGRPVGEVLAIDIAPHPRQEPEDTLGRLYYYQLLLAVDSSVKMYTTDEIVVTSSGLLGEKAIEIVPKTPPPGVTSVLVTNQILYAQSMTPFERTFWEITEVSKSVDKTFSLINGWLTANAEHVTEALLSFTGAMGEVQQNLADVRKAQLVQRAQEGLDHFTEMMKNGQEALGELVDQHIFITLGKLLKNLQHASKSMEVALHSVAKGEGTMGKLLMSDDFYMRLVAITTRANTLLHSINDYGLLFNLNKQWLRLHAEHEEKRKEMAHPEELGHTLSSGVEQIEQSVQQLSLLIEKAKQAKQPEEVMHSPAFRKDFTDLLRLVDQLAENLKLLNGWLIEEK